MRSISSVLFVPQEIQVSSVPDITSCTLPGTVEQYENINARMQHQNETCEQTFKMSIDCVHYSGIIVVVS